MYPWSQAVLAYEVEPTNASPTAMMQAMQSVKLLYGEQDAIGGTLVNDQTIIDAGIVRRTLTFSLGSQFNSQITPAADPTVFFVELYTATLARGLPGTTVTAKPPIVT
jgi:hypothetical protein